jgi:hypothetical protein
MRVSVIICFVVTIILGSCVSKKYNLQITEIPYSEKSRFVPVYSKGPMGERYTWEMHCGHLQAKDPFAVEITDSVFGLPPGKKMITGSRIGEVRHYRITLDMENEGQYKTLRVWENYYDIEKLKTYGYDYLYK